MKQILIIFLIYCLKAVTQEDIKIKELQMKLQNLQFGYENAVSELLELQAQLKDKKMTQVLIDDQVAKLRKQETKNKDVDNQFSKLDMFKNILPGYSKTPKILPELKFKQIDEQPKKVNQQKVQPMRFKQQQQQQQYEVEDYEAEVEEMNLRKEMGI